MDSATITTVTAGIGILLEELGKGALSKAGESLWLEVRSLLGWRTAPKPEEVRALVERKALEDPKAFKEITRLLKKARSETVSGSMVMEARAKNMVVAKIIKTNTFNMGGSGGDDGKG